MVSTSIADRVAAVPPGNQKGGAARPCCVMVRMPLDATAVPGSQEQEQAAAMVPVKNRTGSQTQTARRRRRIPEAMAISRAAANNRQDGFELAARRKPPPPGRTIPPTLTRGSTCCKAPPEDARSLGTRGIIRRGHQAGKGALDEVAFHSRCLLKLPVIHPASRKTKIVEAGAVIAESR